MQRSSVSRNSAISRAEVSPGSGAAEIEEAGRKHEEIGRGNEAN